MIGQYRYGNVHRGSVGSKHGNIDTEENIKVIKHGNIGSYLQGTRLIGYNKRPFFDRLLCRLPAGIPPDSAAHEPVKSEDQEPGNEVVCLVFHVLC